MSIQTHCERDKQTNTSTYWHTTRKIDRHIAYLFRILYTFTFAHARKQVHILYTQLSQMQKVSNNQSV